MKKSSIFYSSFLGRSALLIMLMILSTFAFAQKTAITGTVTDPSNEPIIGATVLIKGTSTGTRTDINGNFTLHVAQGTPIVVSYIGYKTETVNVAGNNLKIVLREDAKTVDEVVVVGYGVQKKSVVTASIAKVSAEATWRK
jgi:hypothetical protein